MTQSSNLLLSNPLFFNHLFFLNELEIQIKAEI